MITRNMLTYDNKKYPTVGDSDRMIFCNSKKKMYVFTVCDLWINTPSSQIRTRSRFHLCRLLSTLGLYVIKTLNIIDVMDFPDFTRH